MIVRSQIKMNLNPGGTRFYSDIGDSREVMIERAKHHAHSVIGKVAQEHIDRLKFNRTVKVSVNLRTLTYMKLHKRWSCRMNVSIQFQNKADAVLYKLSVDRCEQSDLVPGTPKRTCGRRKQNLN